MCYVENSLFQKIFRTAQLPEKSSHKHQHIHTKLNTGNHSKHELAKFNKTNLVYEPYNGELIYPSSGNISSD